MKNFTEMKKSELIDLLQDKEVLSLIVEGFTPERLNYESNKFDACLKAETSEDLFSFYFLSDLNTHDTVQLRKAKIDFLIEQGRKALRSHVQVSATNKAVNKPKKAVKEKKTALSEDFLNSLKVKGIDLSARYTSLKNKAGKTSARVYVQASNVKFLVKEETAKKAGFEYTLIKFNLPASIIIETVEQFNKLYSLCTE